MKIYYENWLDPGLYSPDDQQHVFRGCIGTKDNVFTGDQAAQLQAQAEQLALQGKFNESLALYDNITAEYPGNAMHGLGKEDVLYRTGRLNDSASSYTQALKIDANSSLAWKGLGNDYVGDEGL